MAFVEKSLSLIKTNGVFAIALPAAAISTTKATGLREVLSRRFTMDVITLLPMAEFADAAIRSAVLSGRLVKDINKANHSKVRLIDQRGLNQTDSQRKRSVTNRRLRQLGSKSWASLFSDISGLRFRAETVTLGEISEISSGLSGLKLDLQKSERSYSSNECADMFTGHLPFGIIPAILSRNIYPNELKELKYYIKSDNLLSANRVFTSAIDRVVIRKFVSSTGRLAAAPVQFNAVGLSGVYSVAPYEMDVALLTAILNSTTVSSWIAENTGALINSRFRTVTLSELKRLPVPSALAESYSNNIRNICETNPLTRLFNLVNSLGADRTTHDLEIDTLVEKLYRG